MSRRSMTLTRSFAGLAVWVATAALAVAVPSTAGAATALGGLALTPATGLATSPISMTTVSSGAAKGCPEPTTNIVGYVTGPGAWADGILGVSNTDTGVSLTSDFGVELSDTFSGIAQSNGVTIVPGKYTITVYCADVFGATRYGEFSTSVFFTDATRYQTTDPDAPVATVTTTTVATSPAATAVAGDAVTLTASVAPASAIGTVQFTDTVGGTTTNVGAPVAVTGGTATASTTTLATGGHSLGAVFTPTNAAAFAPSTSAVRAFTVTAAATPAVPTTTTLSASPAAGATAGAPVTLAAAVAPATANGSVQFTDTIGGTTVPVGDPVTVANGSATTATTTLTAVTHSLRAVFTPADAAAFTGSTSSPLAYVVTAPVNPPATTSVALAVTPAGTAEAGTPVSLQATLTPAAAGGTIQFTDTEGGATTNVGSPVTVTQGQASLSTTTLAAGNHSFRAVFTPADAAAFTAATSSAAEYIVTSAPVGPAATSVTLSASPASPSTSGTAVTFTASVTPATAAGTVSFTVDGSATLLGGSAVTVSGGKASVTTSSLPVGSRQITAAFFAADPTAFREGISQPLDYVITDAAVQPTSTTTTLVAAPLGTSAVGADVALTATITPAEAAGTVQFVDDAAGTTTALGVPVTVSGGQAQATVQFSTAGARVLRAIFTPAVPSSFASSASADLSYTVSPATNPQAKPTKVWLSAWPTRWCPKNKAEEIQASGDWDDRKGSRKRCNSAVLVARVAPNKAAGTIQFTDTSGDKPVALLGAPVMVHGGWAVLVAEVAPGRHTFAATFTPADPSAFQASTSNETRFLCRRWS